MAAKPPKGIESKVPVNPLDEELLWHMLQDLSGFSTVEHSQWHTWAFGLMGGVDIAQQSSLLRGRPVRLQIQTHRASIQQFCKTLQIGYEEVSINNQMTSDDIWTYLEIAPTLYYRTRKSVRKIVWDQENDVWWMQDWLGKQWHADEFSPKRGERLILMESIDLTFLEVLHLVLSEQAAHFLNATGIQEQLITWNHHLRRPSLRKSWPSILEDTSNYYWAALQVHHEIKTDSDVAFRELYIQFILLAAEIIGSDTIKGKALLLRKSITQWQRLSTLLLDESSETLSQIPTLDWTDFERVESMVHHFHEEEEIGNVALRLQVFDDTLQKIVEIERTFFSTVVDILSSNVRTLCMS